MFSRLAGLSRTAYRYQHVAKDDNGLRKWLKTLMTDYPHYGCLMLHGLLIMEGLVIYKKCTYRLYSEEKRQVRTKERNKLQWPRLLMVIPTKVGGRWSMDFVPDQRRHGYRSRVLNIVDD